MAVGRKAVSLCVYQREAGHFYEYGQVHLSALNYCGEKLLFL